MGHHRRIDGTKAAEMAYPGDIGDVVGFPGEPFAGLPAVLFSGRLEMSGGPCQVIEDHIGLEDRQPTMTQCWHDTPTVDGEIFRCLLHAGLEVDRPEGEWQSRQR